MNNNNPLETEKISKLLLKYSIPAIIGMTINAFYNIVDRMFIGNAKGLGSDGLAGITIAFPIMIIILAVGIMFGVGGATLFSINLGKKDKESAEKVMGNAFLMLIITSLIITIVGEIFLEPMLKLFGASEKVLPYAMSYTRIIFLGTVFQIAGMGMNNFMRAAGKPKLAMVTMFVGAFTNIILDALFIFVFEMGMEGAALATIISQLVSAIWIMMHFLNKNAPYRLEIRNIKLEKNIVMGITSLGLPGFLTQIGASILNLILNKALINYGGDTAISGMGIINSVQTILLMPIIGLNQGVQPIISFNYGAGRVDRIKKAEKLAIISATSLVTFGFIVTRFFSAEIIGMFNNEKELLEFGTHAIKIWFLMLPLIGFQILASNFFQAVNKPKIAMLLTLTRQIIIIIPAILIFSKLFGLNGILYAAPFSDLIAALITLYFFIFRGVKKI
jgi:putative MATE family efflux protein